jgi:hypothetical protein
MKRARALTVGLVLFAACLSAPGCGRPKNPWTYAEPPAVALVRASNPAQPGHMLIAVADFANPAAPQLPWPTVGPEMSRALRRTLFKDGYQVRIAPDIEKKVSTPGFMQTKPPAPGSPAPEVDYVVIGQVTDFHHTKSLPKDASRWGLIGRRNEAVVAIEWKIVDVRNHKLIAIDHVYGTAESSGRKPPAERYAGLDPSAYLFWNTPLGRAAHDAIDGTVARMRKVLPANSPPPGPPAAPTMAAAGASATAAGAAPAASPVVVQAVAPRQLSVAGPGLVEGDEYYLTLADPSGAPRAVLDCDTGRPLVVTIGPVSRGAAEAWVLGKAASGLNLRGARLQRDLPSEPAGPAAARTDADEGDDA